MTKEEETITAIDNDELVETYSRRKIYVYMFLITLSHPFVTHLQNFEDNAHHFLPDE